MKKYSAEIQARIEAYKAGHREKMREHYAANRERIAVRRGAYEKKRTQSDPTFVLVHRLRSRMRRALQGKSKAAHTTELLGCTLEEFRAHIESLFQEGMTFENRSEWHIDHIRPCSSFDLLDPDQQRECFHYTNLRPLWAAENLEKSDRWDQ